LFCLLTPGSFQPLRLAQGEKKRRDRLLTLPVMMAVVVSLVYRQIPGLSEILRVLHLEGLLWVEPLSVSKQALSKRLRTIPAALFAQVFEQVMQRIRSTKKVTRCLSQGIYYRDEIIQMGQYRSHPCQHPVRLVRGLMGQNLVLLPH